MVSDLGKLACGEATHDCELGEILNHVASNVDSFVAELLWLVGQDDRKVTLLGPFIGRSLIELVFTALVGRLDPFRVLCLREMQRQPGFDLGVRRASSIQWKGDIDSAESPPKSLWTSDRSFEKVSRALLGSYYDAVFWIPSFELLLDSVDSARGGEWMLELRKTPVDSFLPRMRAEANRIYSALSKGMHHEFVVAPGALYDRATVTALIQDALRVCGHLSFVSHTVAHAPFRLQATVALVAYEAVQQIEVK